MIYTLTANPSLDKLYILYKLEVGKYNRGRVAKYDPGGKGINVSRCLKELGDESIIVGFFAGGVGHTITNILSSQGFQVQAVQVDGENRSNITLIETFSGEMTKINEYGPVIDHDKMNLLLSIIEEKTQKGDIWVLSGSLLPGLPNGFYAMVIKRIQSCGGLAFLDTRGMWLVYGYQAVPFALRINQIEAEEALGKSLQTVEDCYTAVDKFRKKGIYISVISLGSEGAVFANKETILDVKAPRVSAKTVIGAGDAMMAMLVHAHINKWPLEKAAKWSVAAGSASVMKEGTSIAELSLIKTLLGKIKVKEIK
jgi:1-phosphofructokinase